MVGRAGAGLVMILLGGVGLVLGWRIDVNDGDGGLLAALSALALAAGCLLAAAARGEVALRVTGGLLFIAGLAVAVTNNEVWWWLPGSWQTPVSLACLVIALVGLGVLLFAHGFSLAGLSGGLGLLALASLSLTLLPYLGSDKASVLRAVATALGAVAFTAGVGAATTRRPGADRRATAVAGAVGAVVAVYAGYDSYEVYAPSSYHAVVIGATIVGVAASLALGTAIAWPHLAGQTRTAPPHGGQPATSQAPTVPPAEQAHDAPSQATPPAPSPSPEVPASSELPSLAEPPTPAGGEPVTTATEAARPSAAAAAPTVVAAKAPPTETVAEPASRTRERLQTASMTVGLVIGLITIAKELVAATLAIVS